MNLLLVVAWIVLAVALVHLVAGWFLSNGLRSGALSVQPREKDLGVRVRRVTAQTIVLESPMPRQDIGHPGIIGLCWPGGYGRVGDVLEVVDSVITRSYETVEGWPPLCEEDLALCPALEMDAYAYPHDPGDVGLGFETTSYQSDLGPMEAWVVPGGDGRRWAVLCHGWTAERRELIRMLPTFHRRGITTMVIDYRNDPDAPADPTGHYRFGLTEWKDVESAVRFATAGGAIDVVLMGCSTGGALVMAFLEHSELANVVPGVVLDAPNIILAETIRLATRDVRATPLMKELGMWIADLRWNIDWEKTNYVQRAERILRVPALVFHGTSDHTVPISVSRQLEARVPGLVHLVETPAAGHVMSWNADSKGYEVRLAEFLDSI